MALSLLAFKPQFLPLAVVALVAGRQYRAVGSMFVTIVLVGALSIPAFGLDSWTGFVEVAQKYGNRLYDQTLDVTEMHSVSAMLLTLGAPELLTRAVQGLVALACVGFVWWLWRGAAAFEYKAAGLAVAILLATPYSYTYDLTLMGLAILWLAMAFQREEWQPGDQAILILAWLVPLSFLWLDVSLAPVALLGLLFVLVRRVLGSTPTSSDLAYVRSSRTKSVSSATSRLAAPVQRRSGSLWGAR